MTNLKREGF